jgi:hypothetical protein
VLAREKVFNETGSWFPDETVEAFTPEAKQLIDLIRAREATISERS